MFKITSELNYNITIKLAMIIYMQLTAFQKSDTFAQLVEQWTGNSEARF